MAKSERWEKHEDPGQAKKRASDTFDKFKTTTLPGRLELPTLRLTASRSNQLSYGSTEPRSDGDCCHGMGTRAMLILKN